MRGHLHWKICRVPAALCLALLLYAGEAPSVRRSESAGPAGTIEIIRDTWGVAHIFAETDEDAMYGLGYAAAEDRAFQMHLSLRIIQGRLSEVIGEVSKTAGRETSVTGDIRMRTLGFYRAAEALAERLDPETLSMLRAYSAGVDDYIAANRQDLLYLFDRLGLEPEPWTPADCIASWWHLGQFFAGDGLGDLANLHNLEQQPRPQDPIVDDDAAVIQESNVDPQWVRAANEFVGKVEPKRRREVGNDGLRFSHAWVVGKAKSTTSAAILVSDPQTPVRNPSLFYEFHVSGKTFNARGIGIAGSPILLIGFSEDLAWGVTALAADQADLFLLQTDASLPDQYSFDGQWRAMKKWKETIRVRGGEDREIELRDTHLGPVVTSLANDVRAGEEVALKRAPLSDADVETVEALLPMLRSRNSTEFDAALEKWRFPSANAVFGDRAGNIGYRTIGAFPYRSLLAPDGGNAAHDGSASRYDWIGMIPHSLVPSVRNPANGYLATANHRPIASFYPIPIFAGTGSGGDTVRSWRLRELLGSSRTYTPDDALSVHRDAVNPARREIVRLGRLLRQRSPSEQPADMVQALDHLDRWYNGGSRMDRTLAGSELAELIPLNFRAGNTDLTLTFGGGEPGLSYFLKTLQRRLESDPDASLSAPESKFIQDALAAGWRTARQTYGTDPARWMSSASESLRRRKMGYFESLDGYPTLDTAKGLFFPDLECIDGGTIKSQASQAYTQWVPLGDPDAALTILPVGLSEHPDSPVRLSCLDAWSKGELHPAPLTRAGVEQYMARRIVLTVGGSR